MTDTDFRILQGRPPAWALPAHATDCHMHYFDSRAYSASASGPPPPPDASLSDYKKLQEWLGLERVVLIQSNAYHKDNSSIEDALRQLGPVARGVVAVDPSIDEQCLDRMHALGVRGYRIMDIAGGAVGLSELPALNARLSERGWSPIVQYNGNQILDHCPLFESLSGDYVIDHVGKFLQPVELYSPEFAALLSLLDRGNCYVKIAGFSETSSDGAPHFADIGKMAKALVQHAPERILWGSNWPHNLAKSRADYPDDVQLLDLACDWMGSDNARQLAFVDNPARLYGF